MRSTGDAPVTIRRLSPPADHGAELAHDVRIGLAADPKRLPSRYFYDARGSRLFEDITRLPEYYLTRAETEILERSADTIVGAVTPDEIVELGSGYSVKTKLLIDAMHRVGSGSRYVPIDISEDALRAAATALCAHYPWLAIDGLVGDFRNDLDQVPHRGRRLVTFLGSTIGNFVRDDRIRFLEAIAAMLEPGDALLLGVDLVKAESTLLAAYDDAAGVTAEFNKNLLHVLNRELDADFPPDAFDYVARWDPERRCVSMGLRARRGLVVTIKQLDMDVAFTGGEILHNEISCKFTRTRLDRELQVAGLHVISWFTDERNRFAMALTGRCDSSCRGHRPMPDRVTS